MKIGIIFKDNDFHNTFFGVLKVLHESWKHTDRIQNDKKQLCLIINNLSPACYALFQNNHSEMFKSEDRSYLYISPDKILLNEEVDEYLSKTSWNNHQTFILDTDLHNNNIYSI